MSVETEHRINSGIDDLADKKFFVLHFSSWVGGERLAAHDMQNHVFYAQRIDFLISKEAHTNLLQRGALNDRVRPGYNCLVIGERGMFAFFHYFTGMPKVRTSYGRMAQ